MALRVPLSYSRPSTLLDKTVVTGEPSTKVEPLRERARPIATRRVGGSRGAEAGSAEGRGVRAFRNGLVGCARVVGSGRLRLLGGGRIVRIARVHGRVLHWRSGFGLQRIGLRCGGRRLARYRSRAGRSNIHGHSGATSVPTRAR